jgi:hypothetical protein
MEIQNFIIIAQGASGEIRLVRRRPEAGVAGFRGRGADCPLFVSDPLNKNI